MIVNRQRGIRVPIRNLERFAADTANLIRLPAESFTVCLVTGGLMARWNRTYRGKARPTDVLSFPSGATNGRKHPDAGYLGDIAIAPAVARSNALRFGRTLEDEMRILILHGILHLMGYDHETDQGQMERREQRLRREFGLV